MKTPLTLLLGLTLLAATGPSSANLYCWTEADGSAECGNRVPPEAVGRGYRVIGPGGVTIETVPPAKTEAQWEQEAALERYRILTERLAERQREEDNRLLLLYSNVEEIAETRDTKLQALDGNIQFARSSIRDHERRLAGLRTQAANQERSGQPVGQPLLDAIAAAELQMQSLGSQIATLEQQKQDARDAAARDLARWRQLHEDLDQSRETETAKGEIENVVQCADSRECDRLWSAAIRYVEHHATMPIETLGLDIVMTLPPSKPQEVGLTLARLRNKHDSGASIFLDLLCPSGIPGASSCPSPARTAVLNAFRATLTSGAASGERR